MKHHFKRTALVLSLCLLGVGQAQASSFSSLTGGDINIIDTGSIDAGSSIIDVGSGSTTLQQPIITPTQTPADSHAQIALATNVPEPETNALMLAGLGLVGFMVGKCKARK